MEDARWSAELFGCADLPIVEVPLPFTNQDPVRIAQMVNDAMPVLIEGLSTPVTAERVRPAFEHITLVGDPVLEYEAPTRSPASTS